MNSHYHVWFFSVKLNIEDEEDEDFAPALNDKPATPPPSEDQESDNDSDMIPDFDSDTGWLGGI